MGDQSGSFAGGLAQGLSQALTFRQQQQRQAEDLALKKKALKLEEDKQKLQQEMAARNAALVTQMLQQFGGQMGLGGSPAPTAPMGPSEAAPALGAGMTGAPTPAPTVAGPSAAPQAAAQPQPAGMGGGVAPRMQIRPSITFGPNGPTLTLNGQPTNLQIKDTTIQDPSGRALTIRDILDPTTGQVVQRVPLGRPVEPEALQRASAVIEFLGVPRADPDHEFFRGSYLAIQEFPSPEAKQAGLDALQAQIQSRPPRPTAGPGPDGVTVGTPPLDLAGVGAEGRRVEAEQEERKTRARERAQREETRLPAELDRRKTALEGVEARLLDAKRIFQANPGIVGKPFFGAFRRVFQDEWDKAGEGQYVGGALASRLRQFLGTASPEEVVFRRTILDAADLTLRGRSGQQINEDEAKRIHQFMVMFSDEPATFGPALNRMLDSVGNDILLILKGQVTAPVEQLRARERRTAPAGSPQILKIEPIR